MVNNVPDLSFPRSQALDLYGNDIKSHYCLCSFLGESFPIYATFTEMALHYDIKAVVDIGCALGAQSWLFANNRIS